MKALTPIDWKHYTFVENCKTSLLRYGFAVIKNHPVDIDLIHRMYFEWNNWFTGYNQIDNCSSGIAYQIRKRKLGYARGFTDNPHEGYFAVEDAESALGREHQDYKEYYHIFESTITKNYIPLITRNITGFYFAVIKAFSGILLERVFEDLYDLAWNSENHLLRVLYYPKSINGLNVERRAAAHTDINLLTVLPYGTTSGLQVKHEDKWIDVPNDPNFLIVNVGDALMEATFGKYPSAEHRVYQKPYTTLPARMSLPFFLHARPEVELRRGLTAEDHLNQRLKELGVT